jgi:hypothetical protein
VLALPGNPAAVFHTTWNLGPLALRPSLSGGLPFSSNYCGPEKPVFFIRKHQDRKVIIKKIGYAFEKAKLMPQNPNRFSIPPTYV